jgi:prepilin-type N-terminal cleavage/methylation domain-containing protein
MKKEGGFTLVELMVVISIGVLLLAWGIPSYSSWKAKHDIEYEMLQLYSDLQFGRMTGYGKKVVSGVYWGTGASITPSSGYHIRYDNGNPLNGNIDGTCVQVGATVTPKYAITAAGAAGQNSVSFDGRGFLNPANPITFSVSSAYGAAINCVAVSSTRVTLGKMNGGICAPK